MQDLTLFVCAAQIFFISYFSYADSGTYSFLKAMAMLLYFNLDIGKCVFCRVRKSFCKGFAQGFRVRFCIATFTSFGRSR